jgi:class 3 adenylate cyclase/tetratricopeptide (TPR) repeat protein
MSIDVRQFGEFQLDPSALELRRNGQLVHLERIPLELLKLLTERSGQVVARDEILERVWGKGVFVDTESSINTAIRKIRRALGDNPDEPRFVVTIPTKGYRFLAPVIIVGSEIALTDHDSKVAPVWARQTQERRHLTILVCELTNSTATTAQSDPEDWWENVTDYRSAVVHAIEHYGGHLGTNRGDCMMAYFGWPEAYDNNAERAALAALAIMEAVTRLNQRPGRPKLSARAAIDCGIAVVSASVNNEADVFGDVPNIAARAQAIAEPGSLLITGAVHQLISGLFVVEQHSGQALQGFAERIKLYRLVRPSGIRGRFAAAAAARPLTPFAGREAELRLLMSAWERVVDGYGQAVLMAGEAGIGKSRLLYHFREQIAGHAHTWLESASSPFSRNTPFYPIGEMLRQSLHWDSKPNAEQRLAALETSLGRAGLKLSEALPLIAQFLELPLSGEHAPLSLTPEQQRKGLLATLAGWACGAAKDRPIVLATEDLHWADASTLELIQLLTEQGAKARLLVLSTARPEFHPEWRARSHHSHITLDRLSVPDVRGMIAQLVADKALSDETINAVIERTSGVPLFVEELTRAVLVREDDRRTATEIPASLQDSLMARLDRLGPAKEILQIGAVIGNEFSFELLQAVNPIAKEDLIAELRRLADAELLYVSGIAPDASYQFKHVLIRDAAYEALLRNRRKELHRSVAQAIDEKFPALKAMQPEVLARHWTEAGETPQAIVEWSRAGKVAEARGAFIEAQESFHQALALLNLLPETPERDKQELRLRRSLVAIVRVTRGGGAPETVELATRIDVLAQKNGDLPSVLWSVLTKALRAGFAGDLSSAAPLADQALELALREGSPKAIAYARNLQMYASMVRGDLMGTEKHFAAGLRFFDDAAFRHNPSGGAMATFGCASLNAWLLGRADIALSRAALIRAAARPGNLHDLAWSDLLAALVYARMREYETVELLAARALDLFEKHRFPNLAATSRYLLGYARAHVVDATEGIALLRQGVDETLQSENRVDIPESMTWLAAAQLLAGAVSDGLETVEQVLTLCPEVVYDRPETLRIRGELLLKLGDQQLAHADFRDSIAMARSMGAKAWELRTTMSLARLLKLQGCYLEARSTLAGIYGWFTEGFDTPDLRDARALLENLQT